VRHEVLHAALEHVFRRGERDKDLFNMAADFIVNHVLIHNKVGKPLKGCLYKPEYSSDDYTVEELYALLEQKRMKIEMPIDMHLDGSGDGNGDPSDGHPDYSAEEQQAIQDNLRAALVQGVQQQEQKAPGSTPAGILRLVDRLLRPRINWREMLDNVMRSTIKHDYTYMRLSRRSWSSGLVLPGPEVLDRVEAVACLDGSGSTTQAMITDFLSECQGIMSLFRDFKLTVMTFDTEVYNVVEFTPDNADDIVRYDFYGDGGTRPSCCWRYMRDHDILPHKLLIFTDGEVGSDWGEEGFSDTLFIIHSNPRIDAPYGQTTHYEPRPSS
jgi:predicted metal-dependent peptidase